MDELSRSRSDDNENVVIDLRDLDNLPSNHPERLEQSQFIGEKLHGTVLTATPTKDASGSEVAQKASNHPIPFSEEYFLQPKSIDGPRSKDKKREYISLLLAVALFVLIGLVIVRATQASQSQVKVAASSGEQVILNFQNTATVSSIAVHTGQFVKKGQLLATQDAAITDAKVKADQANISFDQSAIAAEQRQNSQPTTAQLTNINSDNANIAELQIELNDTISSENQIITTAANEYNSLLQVEQSDQSNYLNICPAGLATQNNQLGSNTCSNLYDQIDSDKRALTAAAGDVNSAEANAVLARDQVQSRLNQANNQLSQDQAQISTTEATSTTIEQLDAKLTADQNILNQDLQGLGQTVLKAPISGVIEEINGNVGQLAGPNGTANFQQSGATAAENAAQPLFQSVGRVQGAASNNPSLPLIVIDSRSSWEVKLLVPQSKLGQFPPGKIVKTSFQIPNKRTFNGVIAETSPIQVDENGISYFQITVNEKGSMPSGLYQGLLGSLN
jgi:multidrug resistance efflux pump